MTEESGIIYCATRKNVDELYLLLSGKAGYSVGRYHAGMSPEARQENQEDFIYDQKADHDCYECFWNGD